MAEQIYHFFNIFTFHFIAFLSAYKMTISIAHFISSIKSSIMMKTRWYPFFILINTVFLLISCQSGNRNVETAQDLAGYEIEAIKGSAFSHATLSGPDGKILEKGPVLDGLRNGTWIKYADDGRIQLLSSYLDGALNGPVLSFSKRGQIDEKAYYRNNLYHGPRVTYRFGRPQVEENYVDNTLDGIKRKYHNNGKIQEEIEYKMGVQDGIYRYYDDQGNMTLDYLYKDGEKVSGGIVEPSAENEQ